MYSASMSIVLNPLYLINCLLFTPLGPDLPPGTRPDPPLRARVSPRWWNTVLCHPDQSRGDKGYSPRDSDN